MRRTHLRGHGNIFTRLLIHVAAFNLALLMRAMFGKGTPKQFADGLSRAILGLMPMILWVATFLSAIFGRIRPRNARTGPLAPSMPPSKALQFG